MSKRDEHTFRFSAAQISEATRAEAEYHEARLEHWKERRDASLERVEATIGAKVVRHLQSGGEVVDVVVDYGDPEAWREFQLAERKISTHGRAAEEFRVDERVCGSQGDRTYKLDVGDVQHFRLGGEPRED